MDIKEYLMENDAFALLESGKIQIEYGPVSMVASCFTAGRGRTDLCLELPDFIEAVLEALGRDLAALRRPVLAEGLEFGSPWCRSMNESVRLCGDPSMTSLAAVAGTVSDLVADRLFELGGDRVIVNNGGDVALRLSQDEEISLGIASGFSGMEPLRQVSISGRDGIGGVATSGQGGRSLSRGVADFVTVFAGSCRKADAFATFLANASSVPAPGIIRRPAGEVDPMTDIPELDVVCRVPSLDRDWKSQALHNIRIAALQPLKDGYIERVCAGIQGEIILLDQDTADDKERTL